MGLRHRIAEDVTKAMKEGDKLKTNALRMALSAVKYIEIEKKRELDDEETIGVLSTLGKQRRESIEQFKKGNRPDLVEKEEKELAILTTYLPEQISEDELLKIVKESAAECGATGPNDMGKLMKVLMPKVKGRADGKVVQDMVKKALSK
ncbi:MAG TPA: GatB/YqeY domain-containing protein [Thermodesulfobacteriota bacterium]|nr:GatB/YqeY domain-containing protein [Thermodesulfobacteriota bacterium]